MSNLDVLGTCPKCDSPVFESTSYYYVEQADEYWHRECLPKSDKGYE